MAKRSLPDTIERLQHIVSAIDEIFLYTRDQTFEQFAGDRRNQLAIIKLYEIIGEAAYKLDRQVKDNYPIIEWANMETMRHILVHNYYEIQPRILWDTQRVYLGPLQEKIVALIDELIEKGV